MGQIVKGCMAVSPNGNLAKNIGQKSMAFDEDLRLSGSIVSKLKTKEILLLWGEGWGLEGKSLQDGVDENDNGDDDDADADIVVNADIVAADADVVADADADVDADADADVDAL